MLRAEGTGSASRRQGGHLLDSALEDEWDARIDSWEEISRSPTFLGFRDEALKAARLSPRDVVVDLGAGTGLLALAAAPSVERVVAVDVSAAMLERIALHGHDQGVSGIELVHGDMRRLPLPDGSVDAVISCYAFHHLVDDGKELSAAEAYRVLRPGGRLVVVDMMFKLSLGGRDGRIVRSKVLAMLKHGVPGVIRIAKNGIRVARGRWEHPATLEWWQQMLERRGFENVDVTPLRFEAGMASAVKPVEPPLGR